MITNNISYEIINCGTNISRTVKFSVNQKPVFTIDKYYIPNKMSNTNQLLQKRYRVIIYPASKSKCRWSINRAFTWLKVKIPPTWLVHYNFMLYSFIREIALKISLNRH